MLQRYALYVHIHKVILKEKQIIIRRMNMGNDENNNINRKWN